MDKITRVITSVQTLLFTSDAVPPLTLFTTFITYHCNLIPNKSYILVLLLVTNSIIATNAEESKKVKYLFNKHI